MDKLKIPDNLIPVIYLTIAALAAVGLTAAGVKPEMTGMIVGAALTRVKMPTK